MVPGREVDPTALAARLLDPALQPIPPRARHGRIRGVAAAAHGGLRLVLPRRGPHRLRFALVRQPHLEALQGGRRARDLGLRLRQEHVRKDHRLGGPRRVADVARQHDLLLLGPRRAERQPLGLRSEREEPSPGHELQRVRRQVAQHRLGRDRVRERRLSLRHVARQREAQPHPGAGAGRQAGSSRRVPERHQVGRQCRSLALGQARRDRGAGRGVHRPGREGRRPKSHQHPRRP